MTKQIVFSNGKELSYVTVDSDDELTTKKVDRNFKTALEFNSDFEYIELSYHSMDKCFVIFLKNSKRFLKIKDNKFKFTKKGSPSIFYIKDDSLFSDSKGKYISFYPEIKLSDTPFKVEFYNIKDKSKVIKALIEKDTEKIDKYITEKKIDFYEYCDGSMVISSLNYNRELLRKLLAIGMDPNQIFDQSNTLIKKAILDFCKLKKTKKIGNFLEELLDNPKFDINQKQLSLDDHPYNLIYDQYKLHKDKDKFKEKVGPLIKQLAKKRCSFGDIKRKRVTVLRDLVTTLSNNEIFVKLMSNEELRTDSELLTQLYDEDNDDFGNYDIPQLQITEDECLLILRAYNEDFNFTYDEYISLFKVLGFLDCTKIYQKISLLIYRTDPDYEINLYKYLEDSFDSLPDTSELPNVVTKGRAYKNLLDSLHKDYLFVLLRTPHDIRPSINNTEVYNIFFFKYLKYDDVANYLIKKYNPPDSTLLIYSVLLDGLATVESKYLKEFDSNNAKKLLFKNICLSDNIDLFRWALVEFDNIIPRDNEIEMSRLIAEMIQLDVDIEITKLLYTYYDKNIPFGINLYFEYASLNCNKKYIEWLTNEFPSTICRMAVREPNYNFIEYLEKICQENEQEFIIDDYSLYCAVESRDHKFITFVYEKKCDFELAKFGRVLDLESHFYAYLMIYNLPKTFAFFNALFPIVLYEKYDLILEFFVYMKYTHLDKLPYLKDGIKYFFRRYRFEESIIVNAGIEDAYGDIAKRLSDIPDPKIFKIIMDNLSIGTKNNITTAYIRRINSKRIKKPINIEILKYLGTRDLLAEFESATFSPDLDLLKIFYSIIKERPKVNNKIYTDNFLEHYFVKGKTEYLDFYYPIYTDRITNGMRRWLKLITEPKIKDKMKKWIKKIE